MAQRNIKSHFTVPCMGKQQEHADLAALLAPFHVLSLSLLVEEGSAQGLVAADTDNQPSIDRAAPRR